ncbi:RNP-1 like RNA-binding protein [Gloeothece citriformis PCC 7424]|uniref:RNP-1 like RNA-binding protein n=1 Tax=Gloeothece citriformis (strain PCC 7424) TaxID=65393 RepID=B7KIR1_GLOC7|nr:RNA-binding protein [Gloeothece citriformis]ACK69467.1 RNP-1 like RNA-binding protein [Gloeothece citriformis PCC 7424]
MPVRLYVGNLPKEPIERQALQEMFAEAGDSITTKVIKDRKTGKCRGFAFVTVPTDEVADQFIEKYNGQPFMDSPIKVEKALPRSKGKTKEEGEQAQGTSEEAATSTPTPAPAPKAKKSGGKKRSRPQGGGGDQRSGNDSFQPDPRWAGELAKLKEMLAAQTTNS